MLKNILASDRISVFNMKCAKLVRCIWWISVKSSQLVVASECVCKPNGNQRNWLTRSIVSFWLHWVGCAGRSRALCCCCALFSFVRCGTYFFNIMSNPTLLEHNRHASGLSWWRRLYKAHDLTWIWIQRWEMQVIRANNASR